MLVLTFQVGQERLALDIRRVREVVPRVHLRSVSGAPAWLVGAFVYRGRVVPVVDLHRLALGVECPPHLSSRIILVPFAGDRLIGLLATQVADIRALSVEQLSNSLAEPGQPDLGSVVADGDGVIRLLNPERLLPDESWRQLGVADQ